MFNIMVLMGRITRDVEMKTSKDGIPYCTFSVACERKYQRPGEERKADFFNVKCWRQTAEFVTKYFRKGSMILVEGEMQISTYEDGNGVQRLWHEVVADRVSFTGERSASAGQGNTAAYNTPNSTNTGQEPSYDAPVDNYPF